MKHFSLFHFITVIFIVIAAIVSYPVYSSLILKNVEGIIAFSDSIDIYFSQANKINYENKLVTDHRLVSYPTLSHNGMKLAFCAEDFNSDFTKSYYKLIVIKKTSDYFKKFEIIHIMQNNEQVGQISWSPDDSKIAFLTGKDIYHFGRTGIKLNILDIKNGKTVQILDNFNFECAPVSWSCDNKFIVFSTQDSKIIKYDLNTNNVYEIAKGSAPQCSPINSTVLFSDLDNIYLCDINGSNKRTLIKNFGRLGFFSSVAWSPDGKYFIYTRYSKVIIFNLTGPTADLVLVDVKRPYLKVRLFSIAQGFKGLSWSTK